MTDIYCGINKLPKNKRIGSMKECAENNKVFLYGYKKIDPAIIKMVKMEKKQEMGKKKLLIKITTILAKIKKLKNLIKDKEGDKDDIKKAKETIKKLQTEFKEYDVAYKNLQKKGSKKK
jgi:seryl-tRNA synthetase